VQHGAKAAFRKSARSRQRRRQAGATEFVCNFPGEDAIDRRVCTILLERNDERAIERGRSMSHETIAPWRNDPAINLPAVAGWPIYPAQRDSPGAVAGCVRHFLPLAAGTAWNGSRSPAMHRSAQIGAYQ